MHKLEVHVIDFEDYGVDDFKITIRNKIDGATIKASATVDIGEWSDSHILNFTNTPVEKFREYFNEK